MLEDIRGQDRKLRHFQRGDLCRAPTNPGPKAGGAMQRKLLAHESGADARKHIAHATRGHAGVTCGVVECRLTCGRDDGACSFK